MPNAPLAGIKIRKFPWLVAGALNSHMNRIVSPPSLVTLPQDELAFIHESPVFQPSGRLGYEYTSMCFAFPRDADNSVSRDLDRVIKGIPKCMGDAETPLEGSECIRRLAAKELSGMAREYVGNYVVIPEHSECEVTEGWVGDSVYWPCNMSDFICRLWAELQSPSLVCLSSRDGRTVISTKWNDRDTQFSTRLKELQWRGLCSEVFHRKLGKQPIPKRIQAPPRGQHCLQAFSKTDAAEAWQAIGACNLCGSSLYEECVYNALLLVGSEAARWLAGVMQTEPYTCARGLRCSSTVLLGRAWTPRSHLDALDKAVQHLKTGMAVCTIWNGFNTALRPDTLYISSGSDASYEKLSGLRVFHGHN